MILSDICDKIAARVLGEFGTVVECMKDYGGILEEGKLYTVEESSIYCLKVNDFWWSATDFRKAIEK